MSRRRPFRSIWSQKRQRLEGDRVSGADDLDTERRVSPEFPEDAAADLPCSCRGRADALDEGRRDPSRNRCNRSWTGADCRSSPAASVRQCRMKLTGSWTEMGEQLRQRDLSSDDWFEHVDDGLGRCSLVRPSEWGSTREAAAW